MSPKNLFRLFSAAALLILAASCTLSASLTPNPTFPTALPVTVFPPTSSQPTSGLPTVQLSPPIITDTPAAAFTPVDTALPAATQAPAATSIPPQAGIRLTMGRGRTVVSANGSVSAGGTASYLVGAAAGQYLMAMINSANQGLYLQIQTPGGSTLVTAADKKNYWQGALPSDGDYLISVVSSGSAGDFNLGVTIPARVVFASGATAATMNATVGANGITTFLMHALQGQTLTVNVISTVGDVYLTIYGLQDGQPYVRSVTGQASANFALPSTQDYVIQCVNTGDKSEDLIVTFTTK